jgi:hypothetical protein
MDPIFLHDWSDLEGMCKDFEIPSDQLANSTVLLASYAYRDYSGNAFVLFQTGQGQLFEVNGGHCSCHGLEDQWIPEETNIDALLHRATEGKLGMNWDADEFNTALLGVLNKLKEAIK